MTATLLQIMQNVTDKLGLDRLTTVVGSSNKTARQLLAISHDVGDEIISRVDWPQLEKITTFTLADSVEGYALPADFDRFIFRTHWDRANTWELEGPLSPQEWEWRQEGISAVSPKRRFRIRDDTTTQLKIDPLPDSGDAGAVMVYEYRSKNWTRPVIWTTGTTFAALAYTFYEGNYYQTTAGGTTGATPPTHTAGAVSDGGVTWTYLDQIYATFLADTDEPKFDHIMFELGIMARWMYQKGFQYQKYEQKFEELLNRQASALKGAKTLSMVPRRHPLFIGPASVPDTGYGP